MFGVVGILAGAAWVAADHATVPADGSASAAPAPDPVAWTERAHAALADLDGQLAMIGEAERNWRRTVRSPRRAEPPAPVRALLARKSLLEQQRVVLTSQLAVVQSVDTASAALVTAQRQVASLDQALHAAPDQDGPQQAATRRQLRQQRDLAEQLRDARQQDLRSLRDGTELALRSPLPDTVDQTTPVVRSVVDLTEGRTGATDPADPPDLPPPDRGGVLPGTGPGVRPAGGSVPAGSVPAGSVSAGSVSAGGVSAGGVPAGGVPAGGVPAVPGTSAAVPGTSSSSDPTAPPLPGAGPAVPGAGPAAADVRTVSVGLTPPRARSSHPGRTAGGHQRERSRWPWSTASGERHDRHGQHGDHDRGRHGRHQDGSGRRGGDRRRGGRCG
ncbi:MAG TPA: hypothetical protein VGH99_12425 [Pseudonocardia sp.]